MRTIHEIAAQLDLGGADIVPYGQSKAKVNLSILEQRAARGRLILVSAITPLAGGEGKTTVAIGLTQALTRLGHTACVALRQPSLGPCLGLKGGATGGGLSQVLPAEDINLHFTGDFHAVAAAHNLLAALTDNSLYHANPHGLDPRRIVWRRVMDMNDRALRHITVGQGGPAHGIPRESGFDITAASEVMAVLCLAESHSGLESRLKKIIAGFTPEGRPVTAGELQAAGAMTALLKDALLPNLAQTTEGAPALIHGGPFANIAHGCNSIIATKMALRLADWAVTEAGFGFDLGGEKFLNLKCRIGNLNPAAVVLTATCQTLKAHGGAAKDRLGQCDPEAAQRGTANLEKHLASARKFNVPVIICLNRFPADFQEEIDAVTNCCAARLKTPCATAEPCTLGGAGCLDLAQALREHARKDDSAYTPLYDWNGAIDAKILAIAREIYGAKEVIYTPQAAQDLRLLAGLGYQHLPICMAKPATSLTGNPENQSVSGYSTITIREIILAAGAGFLIPLTGNIMRMPGLPRNPRALRLAFRNGRIEGLE